MQMTDDATRLGRARVEPETDVRFFSLRNVRTKLECDRVTARRATARARRRRDQNRLKHREERASSVDHDSTRRQAGLPIALATSDI